MKRLNPIAAGVRSSPLEASGGAFVRARSLAACLARCAAIDARRSAGRMGSPFHRAIRGQLARGSDRASAPTPYPDRLHHRLLYGGAAARRHRVRAQPASSLRDTANAAGIAALTLLVAWRLLRPGHGGLFEVTPPSAPTGTQADRDPRGLGDRRPPLPRADAEHRWARRAHEDA